MPYAIVGVLALLLDQALKYWTLGNLEQNVGIQKLIPGVVQLTYIRNYGVAFGALQKVGALRWILLVLLLVFTAVMLYLLLKGKLHSDLGRWSATLLLAGMLGNGIDRAIFGYVVDMIEFLPVRFPIFNIADCLILVCGVLFCLSLIFPRRDALPREEEPRERGRGRRAEPFSEPEPGAEDPFAQGRVPRRRRNEPEPERQPSFEDLGPARRRAPEPEAPRKRRPELEYEEAPRKRRPEAEYEEAPRKRRPAPPEREPSLEDLAPARRRAPEPEAPRKRRPEPELEEAPRKRRPEPEFEEAPPRPAPVAAPKKPAEAPKDEFDLDSIMAEFK